jgi:hypothetical protein
VAAVEHGQHVELKKCAAWVGCAENSFFQGSNDYSCFAGTTRADQEWQFGLRLDCACRYRCCHCGDSWKCVDDWVQ